MILPIVSFGNSILRCKCSPVQENQPIEDILKNMYETMYNAQGVGLAAPQVGLDLSIFIIDTTPFCDDENNLIPLKKEFINPEIIDYSGKDESFNEGCLSIPGLREDVIRKDQIKIRYFDKNFNEHTEKYEGINSRVIQHEYDHLMGVLFTDRVSTLKKKLLKSKLNKIKNGDIEVDYNMKFI
jgi:peptide deformylase|tara:strand:- start:28 stop:576 length:549 start_codon:yes stop_codon:yes gene_type:complete